MNKKLGIMVGTCILLSGIANAEVTDETIRHSYHEKAATAQLLRWYQYYENNNVGIANQRDILTEDFSVDSPSGAVTGRDQYELAVKQFPAEWQNAHDVQNISVSANDNGILDLKADIIFSNIGINPNGNVSAQRMGYEATLKYDDNQLPRFSTMRITAKGAEEVDGFTSTYTKNRLSSLVNYWITLVEHPSRNPEPFREILAPNLDIKFSANSDTLTSYADIAKWVAGPVSSLPASRHVIGPISYTELDENKYEMTVQFDWLGLRDDGKRMTALTEHTWLVTDDPTERFARVQRIRVDLIKPFAVVE